MGKTDPLSFPLPVLAVLKREKKGEKGRRKRERGEGETSPARLLFSITFTLWPVSEE